MLSRDSFLSYCYSPRNYPHDQSTLQIGSLDATLYLHKAIVRDDKIECLLLEAPDLKAYRRKAATLFIDGEGTFKGIVTSARRLQRYAGACDESVLVISGNFAW